MAIMEKIFSNLPPTRPESQEPSIATHEMLNIEAEKIAEAKLSNLTEDGFRNFGIRFANIAEYEQIITSGKWQSGSEVFVPGLITDNYALATQYFSARTMEEYKNIRNLDFNHYLKNKGVGSWTETMTFQTQSASAGSSLATRELLMDIIRLNRNSSSDKTNSSEENSIRQNALKKFREKILEQSNRDGANHYGEQIGAHYLDDRYWKKPVGLINKANELLSIILGSNDEIISEFFLSFMDKIKSGQGFDTSSLRDFYKGLKEANPNNDDLKNVLKLIRVGEDLEESGPRIPIRSSVTVEKVGNEDLAIIFNFVKNPDFIQSEDNLRSVIEILSKNIWAPDTQEQYNIAMIFNTKATGGQSFDPAWQMLTSTEANPNYANDLLGAVVIMPDRKMVEKVVELSLHGGKLSHPVFDTNGNVRLPRKTNGHEASLGINDEQLLKNEKPFYLAKGMEQFLLHAKKYRFASFNKDELASLNEIDKSLIESFEQGESEIYHQYPKDFGAIEYNFVELSSSLSAVTGLDEIKAEVSELSNMVSEMFSLLKDNDSRNYRNEIQPEMLLSDFADNQKVTPISMRKAGMAMQLQNVPQLFSEFITKYDALKIDLQKLIDGDDSKDVHKIISKCPNLDNMHNALIYYGKELYSEMLIPDSWQQKIVENPSAFVERLWSFVGGDKFYFGELLYTLEMNREKNQNIINKLNELRSLEIDGKFNSLSVIPRLNIIENEGRLLFKDNTDTKKILSGILSLIKLIKNHSNLSSIETNEKKSIDINIDGQNEEFEMLFSYAENLDLDITIEKIQQDIKNLIKPWQLIAESKNGTCKLIMRKP